MAEPQTTPVTPTPSSVAETSQPGPTVEIQNDLDDLITSTINDDAKKQRLDFAANSNEAAKKDEKLQARIREKKIPSKIIAFAAILLIVLTVWGAFFLFFQYVKYQETWTTSPTRGSYMPWTERQYEYIVKTLQLQQLDKYNPQQVITTNSAKWNIVERIIDDRDIDYLTKKKVLQEWVKMLYRASLNKFDEYENLKNTVGQQWFFPTDINSLPNGLNFDNSLQKAIISVESIRFSVALKYFSLIDSFTAQLSSYASRSKDDVAQALQKFTDRWEKDISNYITACYLNGYEIGSSCGTIGDFFNYYKYIDTTSLTDPDKKLFLLAMDAIEAKLENTDFQSIDVSVTSIDTVNNSISLMVDINTFKDDEAKLMSSKWVLNPHIYLITSIINQLRESRYVLTDSININTLNVNKKKVRVGWQTVNVNSSSFNFTLPLQKEVQREVYDFSDAIKED